MNDVRRLQPQADDTSAPYWQAAAEGRLVIKQCQQCGQTHWYPRQHCPHCKHPNTEWLTATGQGHIYSFTVVEQNRSSAFRDQVPYAIGLVTLDEGARVFGYLRASPERLAVGAPVVVDFEPAGEAWLPVFTLAEEEAAL